MRRFLHGVFLAVGWLSILVGLVGIAARWAGGPIGPIPGGALHGTFVREIDVARVAATPRVALQVNPAAPRSVTTWVVAVDGEIYVPAAFAERKVWPQIAAADPRVVLRVEHDLVERSAVRITDPALLRRLRAAVAQKYHLGDSDGDADAGDGTWFFRLEPPGP